LSKIRTINFLKGSDYNEREIDSFIGKYIGQIKNGIEKGKGQL
jgi:hypothetical protein